MLTICQALCYLLGYTNKQKRTPLLLCFNPQDFNTIILVQIRAVLKIFNKKIFYVATFIWLIKGKSLHRCGEKRLSLFCHTNR